MNLKQIFPLLSWLFLFLPASAQSGLVLEVSSGLETGIWIYDKGSDDPSFANNQGYDRTHASMIFPVECNLSWQMQRWQAGLHLAYRVLDDWSMIMQEEKTNDRQRYPIAETRVKFFQYGGQLGYALVSKETLRFGPEFSAGLFLIETIHPEVDNFGWQYFLRFALPTQFKIHPRLWLLLRPQYTLLTILPQQAHFPGEHHDIRSLGLGIGLRLELGKK